MKERNLLYSIWLFIFFTLISCGRNINRQEQLFINELNELLDWPSNGTYSDEVMQSVFDFIKKNPQSLNYEFKEEPSYIRITTSDDGNVRAYSLERCGFGGNPSLGFQCKTLLQYRSGKNVLYEEGENFYGFITHICHIDSSKYYLLEDFQGRICQGTHEFYSLSVFKIEHNKLNQITRTFVNQNLASDNLEIFWDDWGGRFGFDYEIADSAFIYNKFTKELYVLKGMPLRGAPLKYRQYRWNKQRFEVKPYDEPIEFCDEKYFIRIEQQSENFWTYKCWNGGKKQGEPNLTINYGTKQYWSYDETLISYDEWVTNDESFPLGEKYTFYNNDYRYEYYQGWSDGVQLQVLYVYDPNEALIYYNGFTTVIEE